MKRANKLAKAAPPLLESELAEMNKKYRAFIFRRSKTRELWTTCCGRYEVVPKTEFSDSVHKIMAAEHHRETGRKVTDNSGWGMYQIIQRRGEKYQEECPYCGEPVYVKELGRTGGRDNLVEWYRFAVIRWYRGALWVRAYDTIKRYGETHLTDKPECKLEKVYRFKPGEALSVTKSWWSIPDFDYVTSITEKPKELPLRIYEPFSRNSAEGSHYTLVGLDEVEKSPLRYCCYKEYIKQYFSPMRFLVVCCIFPRQVEMLMKSGMSEAVRDLVEGRKWNAAAFKWEEENPLTAFDLDRSEMKKYLETDKSLDALAWYKQFRRKGIRCEVADIEAIITMNQFKVRSVIKHLKNWGIEPGAFAKYIRANTDAVNERRTKVYLTHRQMVEYWVDYIDAAVLLGYDLTNPLMRMPKELDKKHNKATKAAGVVIAAQIRQKAEEEAAEQRLTHRQRTKKLQKRYEITLGDYLIRVPLDPLEIVEEGKKLKHCVGGYAERHFSGVLAILFLRSVKQPDVPLATIEMSGNTMKQIHGYNNDQNKKVKPEALYAEFLSPWKKWVAGGSKRDKEGNPVLPKEVLKKI